MDKHLPDELLKVLELVHIKYSTKSNKKTMQCGSRNISLSSLGMKHKQNQNIIVYDLEGILIHESVPPLGTLLYIV